MPCNNSNNRTRSRSTENDFTESSAKEVLKNSCQREIILDSFMGIAKENENFGSRLTHDKDPKTSKFAVQGLFYLLSGWRNLTGALEAFLSKADDLAIHLAYYAEVNAISSMLSLHGIWIEKYKNYYLDQSSEIQKLKKNIKTHPALATFWNVLCSDIDIHQNLSVWKELRIGPKLTTLETVATNSILSSGILYQPLTFVSYDLNLNHLSKDSGARNRSSYRTQNFYRDFTKLKPEDINFVKGLWALSEPNYTGTGLMFETHLLKFLFSESQKLNDSDGSSLDSRKIRIKSLIENTELEPQVVDDLFSNNKLTAKIFSLASSETVEPKNIISRGYIILRMAMSLLNMENLRTTKWYRPDSLTTWVTECLSNWGLAGPVTTGLHSDDPYWENTATMWDVYSEVLGYDCEAMCQNQPPYSTEKAAEFNKISRIDATLIWGLRF